MDPPAELRDAEITSSRQWQLCALLLKRKAERDSARKHPKQVLDDIFGFPDYGLEDIWSLDDVCVCLT